MARTGFLLTLLVFSFLVSKAQPPSVHASNIKFTNVYCNELRLSWSAGNGDSRVVFVRDSFAVDTFPTDYQSYNANTQFGVGSQLKNSYTAYSGNGNSVTISGLKKGTTYHFAIFEFNNNSGQYEYYTSTGYATGSVTTGSITADFTINDRYQCLSGNSFSFTNSSTNTIGGGMTYSWDFGDGSTVETTTNTTHKYALGGIFKVKLTARTTGCVTDTINEDTVVVPYNVDFGLDTTISKDTVECYGTVQFNILNQSKVPNPPIYGGWDRSRSTWTTSQGHKGTAFNFDFQTSTPGKIDVKLVMARQVQKGEEFCLDSIERVLELRPPPLDTNDIWFSDSILCESDNEFTFSHSSPDIVTTTWLFGDGDWSNDNPATHSYAGPDRYEVTLLVEDVNGCEGQFTDTVEVVATPNNFFTGLSSTYCVGDPPIKLDPNLGGGRFEGGSINSNDSTFNPNVPGVYTIDYIYTIGNCKDTFSATTTVYKSPTFSIGNDTVMCSNTDIMLTADSANFTYTWDDNSTGQTRLVSQPGTYWARGTDGQCYFSDTMRVRRVTLPELNLGNDTTICGGESVNFDISADAGTIVWNDGSSEGFSRTVSESGFYKATITHPCGVVSDSINIDILPTACDIFIPNVFSPNNDNLNETFYPQGLFKFTSLMIFDEYGMNLFESYVEGVGWDGKVNSIVCQPGTYYFIIRYQLPEEGTYVKKVASGPLYLLR